MLFAFGIIPLLGAGALAVDYTYAETMRTKLAVAADVAALAGAQLYGGTQAQRIARAQDSFSASLSELPGVTAVSFTAADVISAGVKTGFKVEARAHSETFFGQIYGKTYVEIGANAQATLGASQQLEIALVLDVTGSMAGTKLDAMKLAATKLVNDLTSKATTPDQVKFSIVPFANYVNVGMANRNKPWINVPPDTTGTWSYSPEISRTNCRMQTFSGSNDGIPYTYQGEVCDVTYGPAVTVTSPIRWWGCVGSRNSPLDTQDANYATPVPGLLDDTAWCSSELTPLTSNATTLTNAIAAMWVGGETYIPAGLMWGWRTLSPGEPFGETRKGTLPDKDLKRFVILMTDGANTKSPSYPTHYGADASVANTLTSTICNNIKEGAAAGPTPEGKIGIYTIAFEVTDVTIKNVLETCASSPSYYFDASNSAQLSNAFDQIGASLSSLRLAK